MLKSLNFMFSTKLLLVLSNSSPLTARLFHQAFISFRKYIMESGSLSPDVHIILNDICCGAGKHIEYKFPLKFCLLVCSYKWLKYYSSCYYS